MIAWLRRLLAPTVQVPLTWRAQWVVHAAVRHAEGRGARMADAGDLLYGLARADEGVGRAMLSASGVSLDDLLPDGEVAISTSQRPPALETARWGMDVERVIAAARAEAARVGHRYVGTEHLVLGLLHHVGGAGQLLRDRGASLTGARREMLQLLRNEV